jgi:flagella basal body P-ring formation protein FlgA
VPGAVADPAEIVGLEARVALYPGRPIRPGDVGLPAVVERNQVVPLIFQRGTLLITAEGRALDRAGPGDVIRVMNVASRTTVSARVGADGAAYVSQ